MLYSMTGYGEAVHDDERIRVGFRLRTVNNKGLDISVKLPFDLMYMEARLRGIIKQIHDECVEHGTQEGGHVDYFKGANIAGFKKVADAMLAFGVV